MQKRLIKPDFAAVVASFGKEVRLTKLSPTSIEELSRAGSTRHPASWLKKVGGTGHYATGKTHATDPTTC